MSDEKNYPLIRSNTQRFIALANALGTVDSFIIPSVTPDLLEKYEEVKKYLLETYKESTTDSEIKNYQF